MDQWLLDEAQMRFEVPFFIWANFDIEERDSVFISANYLSALAFQETGIVMSPYQKFVMQIHKSIPVMNIQGYLGEDGRWYDYNQESPYSSLLSDYWIIQYNNIFAKRKLEALFSD